MNQARIKSKTFVCTLCIFVAGLLACTNQNDPISADIVMPTPETNILAKTTLVVADAPVQPEPTARATQEPQPEAVSSEPDEPPIPTDTPVTGESLNITPEVQEIPVDTPVIEPTQPVEVPTIIPTVEAAPETEPTIAPTQPVDESAEATATLVATPTATLETTETQTTENAPVATPTAAPTDAPAVATPTPTESAGLGSVDSPTAQVIIDNVRVPIGERVELEIRLRQTEPFIGSVDIGFTYDSEILALTSCQMGLLTGLCSPDGDGIIDISAVNNGNVQQEFLFVTLEFEAVTQGNSVIDVSSTAAFVDADGNPLIHTVQSGSISVQ